MRELLYAMRFSGQAAPVGTAGSVLRATAIAPSSSITTSVDAGGLSSEVKQVGGDAAIFASEVTFTSDTGFQEVGTVTFGEGNVLHFCTVGSGYLGASADQARRHGTVMWRVERGEGQLAGATGLITSNFFVGETLEITDHQFGILLLPEHFQVS